MQCQTVPILEAEQKKKLSVFELFELFYYLLLPITQKIALKLFRATEKEILNVCFSLKRVSLQIPKLKDDTALS